MIAWLQMLLNKIGSNSDTAAMDDTLFAGQQQIDDDVGTALTKIGANDDAASMASTLFGGQQKIDDDVLDLITRIKGLDDIYDLVGAIAVYNPRAEFESFQGSTSSTTYVTAVSVTGSGKLYDVLFRTDNGGETASVRITIDGYAIEMTVTGDTNVDMAARPISTASGNDNILSKTNSVATNQPINFDFQDSLLIEYKCSGGANCDLRANYGVS